MRFSVVFTLAATFGYAAAQTATGSAAGPQQSSSCAAQNIVEACKSTTGLQVSACTVQDWRCLCDAYTVVLTCYDSCPGDPNRSGAESQKVSYCNAADGQSSLNALTSSIKPTKATATTAKSTVESTVESGAETSARKPTSRPSSASASAADSSSTGAAGAITVPAAGGLFAALMGVVAQF
ncbi:hypothetical protein P152DRAFT_480600 [Eremomyces bilateralis CBS 781.70]|uniref:GPI anchored serine-threonine rich protein n=1 Tax=Eremomyces bilateralis CBS 781.70 TaxID=1392243 RepID=A0A6G1G8L0_9PEZI|nr:uncharacterized protein P152DRAFT_480600 [Eremomyces bilateralis CBS 781.70]KAF1814408.1 hypothetical protein P152DRAFT_480600 [Eremomyces bilateralis CBS 781.70]